MSTKKTIAKSFTVSTIEDGVSVQAQYAPNANPTSGQIHTVWHEGDLYMRTRESDESAWSSWHKIVGENGGETDYSFYISAYPSSADAQTAPADIQPSNWQDTPMQITDARPYLWMRTQKKAWNSATQSYDITSTSYVRINGESILYGDLTQEWYSVSMTNLGETSVDITFETTIHLYYGSTLQTLSSNPTVGTLPTGVTVQSRTTGGKVTFKIAANTSFTNDRVSIPITATCAKGSVTKYLLITGIRGGAVYQLVPSASEVVKHKNGTFTPSTNLTCSVSKITNGITSTPAASEYILKMEVNGGSEQDYAATSPSSITSNLVFILYVGGVQVDKETIPLITDGDDGVSITSADVVFGLSTSETTAPSPDNTTTWKTSIAALSLKNSDKNKYIWQCTKIKYSNGNTVYTGKMCLGIVSSFADIVEQYALGTASAATGTWQDTTPPVMANGYYLWTRTKLVYSDNSVSYAPSSNGYCVGYYGVDGTSITGANVWYALSTSNSSAPQDSAFTLDDFPTTLNAGYYVWEATKITFTSGSPIFTGKMCLGATSDFLSGTEVYAISTSNSTAPADNKFGTTYSKTKGYYLWTATRVQYTNGNYAYLNKKCVGYWGEDGTNGKDGTDGTNGQSVFFVDLSNETENIACNNDGNTIAVTDLFSEIFAFYGLTSVVSDCKIKYTHKPTNATAYIQASGSGTSDSTQITTSYKTIGTKKYIRLRFNSGVSVGQHETLDLSIQHATYGTLALTMTIIGINGGATYQLVPSTNTISKGKNGTYSPSTVTCSSRKIDAMTGGTTNNPSEATLKYTVDGGSTLRDYSSYLTAGTDFNKSVSFLLYVDGKVVDAETIGIVEDGTDGTSPIFADLDNEMDSVACDSNGNTNLGEQYVSTNFYYYKGSTKQTQAFDSITCKIDGYDLGTSYTSNFDPSRYFKISSRNLTYGSLTIAVKNGTSFSGNVEVKCTVVMTIDGASVSRTLTLTINGVRAGKNGTNGQDGNDAILFNLLPSLDSISFARTSSGGLTPSERELSLVIKKTDGGTASIISISNSGLSIRYSFLSMPSTSSSGTNWGVSDSTSGTSWYNGTLHVSNSVTFTNIYIAAFNSNGVLVDRETIPVVKDGNNGTDGHDGSDGDDGVSYCIVFTKAAARVDENNTVTAELAGYAYKYVGGVRSALANTTIRYGYILTDSDTYVDKTTNSSGFFDAGMWFNGDDITDYGKDSPSIFAAIVIGGTVVHAEMITISVNGSTGSRGKVGRFFYYAGEWDNFSSTDSFLVNDAQAPYVAYNSNYWVFNPETNGTYTKQDMGTPSSSSSNWQLMTSDFKYIITEAIFGNYAHFGSAVINGDWLLSTNGKIGITDYNNGSSISGTLIGGSSFSTIAYTLFDPQNPLGKDNTVKNGTTDVTIATSETTHTLGTVDLVSGTTYQITCKGKRNGSTAIYVRVRNNSYGTGQLIYYPSTTEGEYRAFFRVTTSATYTVEMYQPTTGGGGVTSMWSIDKVVFSPNYAVDLLTGAVIQYESYMQGFIKKSRTIINSSNINKYAYKSIFDDMVLDFDKCGNFIELQYQGSIYFALPMLSSYLAPKYTEDQKTQIRSFIGSNMIVYNKTGSNLTIVYKLLESSTYATTVGNNGFIELECHTDIDTNSKEVVFWEIVKQGTMV